MFKSLEEAKRFIEEKSIKMVDFMMIDLNGRWRHLTIPADRFTEDTLKNGRKQLRFRSGGKERYGVYTGSVICVYRSVHGDPYPCDDRRRLRYRRS